MTDASFCTATAEITISEGPPVEADIAGNPAACGEGATGTATAVAISGTPPFTYFWDNLSTDQTITGLQQGNYSVTITDANGCKGTADFSLVVVEDLDIAVQGTNLNCFGNNSGTATATGSGGDEPYAFQWSNGAGGSAISNLQAGQYSVTLTEANGCSVSATLNIAQPPLLQASISTHVPLCPGDASGSLTTSVSGGIPPYSILWNTGANTGTIQNLPAGDYSVTIADVNGCTVSLSSTIAAFPEPDCSIQLTSPVIAGNDGALTAQVSGGAPPYSYLWNSGQTTAAITGLSPGMYTLTITDANGCSSVCNTDLFQLAGLGDFVWEDLNKNGIQEPGEPGVEGVMVKLKDGSGQVIGATQTDNTGYYEFTGLQAGSYSVMFTLPEGFHYTLIDATLNDSLDSDVDLATLEMTPLVSLALNTFNPTLDAGIYRSPSNSLEDPCHCLNNATTEHNGQFGEQITIISYPGETWQVIEATGMWDPNSPEPPGIPVPFGVGAFFTETSPGVYVLPFKLIDAIPYSARLSNGTDILMIGNNCTYPTVNLSGIPAEMCIYDPPFVPTANPGVPGQITYFINGEQVDHIDPADLGIGLFEFVALLTPINPNECQARIVSMLSIVNNCFAQLGDYVWEDLDRDGIQDDAEPGVPDVTVRLKNAQGTVIDSTLTDAGGYYLFDSLPPATYSVWFVLPYGYRFTVRNAGNDDTLDNDADMSMMGMSHTTSLMTDEMDLTLDAGIYLIPTPAIGDPCNCLNNSTTEDNGQFTEEFTVHSYPGETWRLIGNEGMYQFNSPEPPAAPIQIPLNTIIQETAPGEYVLPFRLVDWVTYTAVVTNGFDTLSISNTCGYPVVNLADLPAELCISDAPFTPTVNPEMPGVTHYYVNGVEVPMLNPQVLQPGLIEFTTVFIPDSPEMCETRIITEILITEDCLAKLGDYVWLDLDHDGRQEPGEPGLPNVKVTVNGVGNNYMDMTTTDNTGMYMFLVPPGTYKVTFGQPEGLIPTIPNAAGNDATDSDMDPLSFMAPPVTLGPDEMNLTIDAGFYTLCENITQPGQIGYNQVLCGPGNDPAPFVSITGASGGEGQIEYLWMMSASGGHFNDGSWVPIPNSNSPAYDSGPLFATTYFVRCARREDCTAYLESNILVVEVDDQAVANIGGPDFICQGETHTYTAVGAGQNAVIQWHFGNGAIPQTATGHTAQVAYSSFGTFQITLTVTENGCTSTDISVVVVTNSPTACPDVMGIDVAVTDQEARTIQVSWEVRADGLPLDFTVQHAADGVNFRDIGLVNTPSAISGGNRKYNFEHQSSKMGRNYYRVRIRDGFGHTALSETGSAILYSDSKLAVVYPNPVKDKMILELFETFDEPVQVELIGINGIVLQKQTAGKDVEWMELDLSPYPSGAYVIRLKFGKTHVKTLRVVKGG